MITHKIPFDKSDDKSTSFPVPIKTDIQRKEYYNYLFQTATQQIVLPKRKSIQKTIMKMDAPLVKPDDANGFWILAKRYTKMHFYSALRKPPGFESSSYNTKASAGITFKRYGLRTKLEAMMKPELLKFRLSHYFDPLFENCPKREFLPTVEILDDKIRTFLNSDFDFILRQKFLYDNQNEGIYERSKDLSFFCRYGFVKEYGGYNRFCHKLKNFRYIFSSDISGWDRKIPCMSDWYNIRNELLVKTDDIVGLVDYVTQHTVYSYVIDEEGIVFRTHQGNRSGSNNTTTDNCGSHVLIMFYLLIKLFHIIHGREPSYLECCKNFINVMGDDNLSGLDDDFIPDDVTILPDFIINTYAEFGLQVKMSAFKYQFRPELQPLDEFEFLGSTLSYLPDRDLYVPIPRRDKVASTILYAEGKMTIDRYAQRLCGLACICYGDEILLPIIIDLLQTVLDKYAHNLEAATIHLMSNILCMAGTLESLIFGFESKCHPQSSEGFILEGGFGFFPLLSLVTSVIVPSSEKNVEQTTVFS
jgi:hypothetical protein